MLRHNAWAPLGRSLCHKFSTSSYALKSAPAALRTALSFQGSTAATANLRHPPIAKLESGDGLVFLQRAWYSSTKCFSRMSESGGFRCNQVRYRSNRSRRGLYDGKDIRSGNKVSFSMKKTKRKFRPNVFQKRVYSEVLDEMIRFHLTASALRSIDKAGGLDNYLLTNQHVVEGEGQRIKNRILKKMEYQTNKKKALDARTDNAVNLDEAGKPSTN